MKKSELTPEEVQLLFPDLSVIRFVGKGSFKFVYEVYSNNVRCALKILTDDVDYNRLGRETDAMRIINSPFVAKLYEFLMVRKPEFSVEYILEEFIEGDDLKKYIDNFKIYTAHETIIFLDQILQGLEACWENKIVHRDIKPANIMVRNDGSPVIVDFGLSRHLDMSSLTSTNFGGTIGTPYFAPPELLEYTKNDIDSKTDLYSLGVTVYMMCTGRHPYSDVSGDYPRSIVDLLTKTALPPHEINPEIPESLSRFILRLMDRHRVKRPRDATQARNKLSQLRLE